MSFEEYDYDYNKEKNNNQGYLNVSKKNSSRSSSYGTDDVVSVGVWIALSLVLGIIGIIPLVGPFAVLIILIAMAFMDINENLKNWARANLILGIIGVIILFLFIL